MEGKVTEILLNIVEELALDFSRALTIRQIAKNIGKPYPNTHKAAKQLEKEGVIQKTVVGHAHACRLDLKTTLCQSYIGIIQARKSKQVLESDNLRQIIRELESYQDILFIWKRPKDLLIVTTKPVKKQGLRATWVTLEEFKDLKNTINEHALIFGNSLYPALLSGRLEVLR